MNLFFIFACNSTDFDVEKERFDDYQKAIQFYEQGNINSAIEALENLKIKESNSRAILERLLYWYLESKQVDKGLQLAEAHLFQHPGDTEIRIARSKLLLESKQYAKAVQDIQILLHNKKIHQWEIANDPFYQKYSNNELMKNNFDFSLLKVNTIALPDLVLVGDYAIAELQFLHLYSCSLKMKPQLPSNLLRLTKLHLNSERIDQWVSKTNLTINWEAASQGSIAISGIEVQCGEHIALIDIGEITVRTLEVNKRKQPSVPILVIPSKQELLSKGEGIQVTIREQGIVVREGIYPLHTQ
jgi:hypothetical protein